VSASFDSAAPKYLRIAGHLRDLIVRGDLPPGSELPSERQLVDEWKVSRPTATRALAVLRAEGLAEARQGSGTYVRSKPLLSRRARDRYARSRETGKVYTPGEYAEILSASLTPAPPTIAAALALDIGTTVVRRERLIRDPDGPVELSVSWLEGTVAARAPLLLELKRIREGTLAYVERCTRRRGVSAEDRIQARLATKEERATLDLTARHAAVLNVAHTVYDAQDMPLEFVDAVYPQGHWAFTQQYALPG
jgi:GntR family transcriptional regulator